MSIEQVLAGERRWVVVEGDCLETMRSMPESSVEHVITDPPYSAHTHGKQWIGAALTADGKPRVKTAHAGLGFDPLTAEVADGFAQQCVRLCARWVLAFSDIEGFHVVRDALMDAGLDPVRVCIWDKVDGAPQFTGDRPAAGAEAIVVAHQPGKKRWNGGGRRNVFRHAVNGDRGPKPHPSTKPLKLMLELVALFTDPDDVILDPFCGSGTTGVAALRLGRRFIGMELDPGYAQTAMDRLTAESQGMDLNAYRAGQLPMFGGES